MIHFKMSVDQKNAAFCDSATGELVLVESRDNRQFNVRVGSLKNSRAVGSIVAENDRELNERLNRLVPQQFHA